MSRPHRSRRPAAATAVALTFVLGAGVLAAVPAGATGAAAATESAATGDAPAAAPRAPRAQTAGVSPEPAAATPRVASLNSATVGLPAGATATAATDLAATERAATLRTGTALGTLRIPRFGADWSTPIAEGTNEHTVLATNVGHYPGTAMPGGDGNFALAGHRTSYDAPFFDIEKLVIGDAMIVETDEGWFAYRYRSSEYVPPSAVDVLNAVPRFSHEPAGKYITLTACNPLYSTAERIIAYGTFESFTPRTVGAK